MNASASKRLQQLHDDINACKGGIAAMRTDHAALVANGDDNAADALALKVRDAESRLAVLHDRLPVLEQMAEDEAAEAQAVEAAALVEQANAKQAELLAQFAKVEKLAQQLGRAVAEIDDNAGLHWYRVANKALKLGGQPDKQQISDCRALLESLAKSRQRLAGIAESYSQRLFMAG
ncbi:hypothetical protein [Halopseudomonas salegens]|uniref:Uncharacterized protein n=1 Tax=Halopseudomonas salegens TaxID=1434072 RepID=A0A1H2HCI5_9GAMM|nr:hypothetical protein [Halopseudomonas salegens]SDU29248.1 hypothetical protein SAMN05216210_2922 [Halopseudomonas salegens]